MILPNNIITEGIHLDVTGQLHSPNGDSDNSNGSQRAVAVIRSEVEQQQQQQQQLHRQRQQQRQATATVPVLACTNQSSITTTTTALTVASSMLLLQTQVSSISLLHDTLYLQFSDSIRIELIKIRYLLNFEDVEKGKENEEAIILVTNKIESKVKIDHKFSRHSEMSGTVSFVIVVALTERIG